MNLQKLQGRVAAVLSNVVFFAGWVTQTGCGGGACELMRCSSYATYRVEFHDRLSSGSTYRLAVNGEVASEFAFDGQVYYACPGDALCTGNHRTGKAVDYRSESELFLTILSEENNPPLPGVLIFRLEKDGVGIEMGFVTPEYRKAATTCSATCYEGDVTVKMEPVRETESD
jgi:hypothetical protein